MGPEYKNRKNQQEKQRVKDVYQDKPEFAPFDGMLKAVMQIILKADSERFCHHFQSPVRVFDYHSVFGPSFPQKRK
jgi:hypothetical protein